MDLRDLLEYLVPFIFVVFWVIGSIFEGKRRNQQREEESRKRQERREAGQEEDRPKTLEEIFGMEEAEEDEELFEYPDPEEIQPQVARQVEQPQPLPEEIRLRDYEEEIREQRKKIQEARLAARRAQERHEAALVYGQRSGSNLKPFAKELVSMLKTPYATKKAIMSYEILGTPVGMRENGMMKRSWD